MAIFGHGHRRCGLRPVLRQEAVVRGDLWRSTVNLGGGVAGIVSHARAVSAPRPEGLACALTMPALCI
eukprot:6888005-Alexandrium_andersonii.AAC.1